MENWTLVERKPFACVSDAVAHYYGLGFKTWEELDSERIMRKGIEEVRITKRGFLDVSASHIRLD
jgi:hypothetical protein